MTDINLKDWQAENLRLSVFMVDPIDPLQTRSWERLVGSVPDELRTQPPQQLVTEEGPFLNGRLRVEARGNRFDWRLFPDLKQLNSSFEFPPVEIPRRTTGLQHATPSKRRHNGRII